MVERSIQFKVENGRILVPVGEPCSFACKYCYTRTGEVGPARAKISDIWQQFQRFAEQNEFETIQFGYDGDPFARAERGFELLSKLVTLNKNVNFSTKAFLHGAILQRLAALQKNLEATDHTLSALVSLSCWQSASTVEPHTPTPAQRITTIKNLKSLHIPTLISVRPILPHIPDDEYERIIDEGIKSGCDGFILGPLYADNKGRFVRWMPQEVLKSTPSEKRVVSWSPHAPVWTRYEDEQRSHLIEAMIQGKGGRVFFSSADAVRFFSLVGASI